MLVGDAYNESVLTGFRIVGEVAVSPTTLDGPGLVDTALLDGALALGLAIEPLLMNVEGRSPNLGNANWKSFEFE